MTGLEDFVSIIDDSEDKTKSEHNLLPQDAADKNKEEDLFDFSFLIADDDEDDDMSSNISDFKGIRGL